MDGQGSEMRVNTAAEAQAMEDRWREFYRIPCRELNEREMKIACRFYRSSFPYMSLAELKECTASKRVHGIEWQKEMKARGDGIDFIRELASHFEVSTTVKTTAQILFHRYFVHASLRTNDRLLIAATSFYMSCKGCSEWQSLEKTALAYQKVRGGKKWIPREADYHQFPSVLKQVQEHIQLAERTMLYALNFDVNVHLPLPSTSVVREAWQLGYKEDHPIVQQALNVVKASYKSTLLCISHPPEALAGAALLWGGERTGRELKLPEGKTLAEAIGSTDEAINEVLGVLRTAFPHPKKRATDPTTSQAASSQAATAAAAETAVPVAPTASATDAGASSEPATRQATIEEGELPAVTPPAQAPATQRPLPEQQAAPVQAPAQAMERQPTLEEGEVPASQPSPIASTPAAAPAAVASADTTAGNKRPHSAVNGAGHSASGPANGDVSTTGEQQAQTESATDEGASRNGAKRRRFGVPAQQVNGPANGTAGSSAAPAASTSGTEAAQPGPIPATQPEPASPSAQAPGVDAQPPQASTSSRKRSRDDADDAANGTNAQLANGSTKDDTTTPSITDAAGCAAATVAAPTANGDAAQAPKKRRTDNNGTCAAEGPETPSPSASPTPASNNSPHAVALVAAQGANSAAAGVKIEAPGATMMEGIVAGAVSV